MATLLEECITILGPGTEALSHADTRNKVREISARISFGINGIDWCAHPDHFFFTSAIVPQLPNKSCFVMWDEYTLPILRTDLERVLQNIDDVTAVAFDTWVIGSELDWVIEFHHEGTVHFTPLSK